MCDNGNSGRGDGSSAMCILGVYFVGRVALAEVVAERLEDFVGVGCC